MDAARRFHDRALPAPPPPGRVDRVILYGSYVRRSGRGTTARWRGLTDGGCLEICATDRSVSKWDAEAMSPRSTGLRFYCDPAGMFARTSPRSFERGPHSNLEYLWNAWPDARWIQPRPRSTYHAFDLIGTFSITLNFQTAARHAPLPSGASPTRQLDYDDTSLAPLSPLERIIAP